MMRARNESKVNERRVKRRTDSVSIHTLTEVGFVRENLPELSQIWEETKLEFVDFHRWITLERTGMENHIRPQFSHLPFLDLVVGRTFADCAEIFGDPRALSLIPTNDSNRAKKPFGQQVLTSSSSGMGWGTSYFGGKSHLELQVQVAERVLQPLYARLGETGNADAIQYAETMVANVPLEQVGTLWKQWLDAKQPVPPDQKIPARAKKVWRALKAIRRALMTRTKRIQGQMPENSCLAFCTREENTRLFLLAHHPVHGISNIRLTPEKWAAQPFKIPNVNTTNIAQKINELCTFVRDALAGNPSPPDIVEWVGSYTHVLADPCFSLSVPFIPSEIVVPETTPGELLLWQGPHWTVAGNDSIKYTTFVDAVPRTFFSEQVWAFIWECNKVCPTDLGGGSYRDSYMTWHYMKARGHAVEIPQGKEHYFGAPTDEPNTVCIVPERFRIKRKTKWGMIHIDRNPLPTHVEEILATI